MLHTQKHGWRAKRSSEAAQRSRQPCFCVCSTGLMCSRTCHGASDLDGFWHDCLRRLSTAANSTFARRNRAQQLPDILGRRDAKNSSCKWFYTRAVRERRVRRESPRCNFSRPSVFANFEAHGIVSRELWNAAKLLTRLQRICEPCQPGALSRERTRECKSAEQMDARYARGRTALVERRERFYGLGSRLPRHLAPLFPKTQFLKSTKRVSQGLFRW